VPHSAAKATAEPSGWVECLVDPELSRQERAPLLGVLPGDGVGREVVGAALEVVRRLERAGGQALAVEFGGPIGCAAEREFGDPLPEDTVRFCRSILERGGALLNGPGGGRYVYDLRRRLDLFLKISPVQVRNGLPSASPLRSEALEGVDLLIVRENVGGVYQGRSEEILDAEAGCIVRHTFSYSESEVRRFLGAAARLASSRRGELTVVTKEAGVPAFGGLWRICALEAAEAQGVRCSFVDVDLLAYQLVRRPQDFDVIAAPNLCGDVLSDLAAVLIGSRALSFAGNFSPRGDAVYQTGHGAAYDISGTDCANPVGQILSMAMLLRESIGLEREAWAVEEGIRQVWSEGFRTADVANGAGRTVGTREMAELVADAARHHLAAAPGSA
jgi:3-isopropylmalate dehydrogenase